MSTCLYGDATSLGALYQCMEKPVLFHNLDVYGDVVDKSPVIDLAGVLRKRVIDSTKAFECALYEHPNGFTLKRLLDILACNWQAHSLMEQRENGFREPVAHCENIQRELIEQRELLSALVKKQRELILSEISNSDGTAGAAIWEHCKSEVLH